MALEFLFSLKNIFYFLSSSHIMKRAVGFWIYKNKWLVDQEIFVWIFWDKLPNT